jgi:hypothetical protein
MGLIVFIVALVVLSVGLPLAISMAMDRPGRVGTVTRRPVNRWVWLLELPPRGLVIILEAMIAHRWIPRVMGLGIVAFFALVSYQGYRDGGVRSFRYDREQDTLSLFDEHGALLRVVRHPCPGEKGSFWNSRTVNNTCEFFREQEEERRLLIDACQRHGIPLDARCTWEVIGERW